MNKKLKEYMKKYGIITANNQLMFMFGYLKAKQDYNLLEIRKV